MKKIISILITISILLTSVPAFAISGTGTESNPYLISSASDIAKMHNDLDGYYKFTADIDMTGVDFEPIGNENEGAFTGTIDGDGYTISNLNINLPDNKYVGFIGYLEGVVKNLTFSNIYAYGYRYIGGIAGYVEDDSQITECTVSGEFHGKFSLSDIYIGSIAGNNYGIINDCVSYGSIYSYSTSDKSYIGGIAGRNYGLITNCKNNGHLTSKYSFDSAGGITGFNQSTVKNCINNGNISDCKYIGGIVGYNLSITEECINNGTIFNGNYIGGIAGYNYFDTIKKCINNGKIDGNGGGIVGLNNNGTIELCINSGSKLNDSTSVGAMVKKTEGGLIENCINHWGVIAPQNRSSVVNCIDIGVGGCVGTTPSNIKLQIYKLQETGTDEYAYLVPINMFRLQETFGTLDFVDTWFINTETNSGFPQLRNMPEHIDLNECVEIMEMGDTDKLYAYIDGNSESVIWSCDDTSIATVSADGTVEAKSIGTTMVTATNADGMKANCLVYVYGKADSISLNKTSTSIVAGSYEALTYTQNPEMANEVVLWSSDNEKVATVDQDGLVIAKEKGTATITATTTNSNLSATCEVTVTGAAITGISLSSTSASMNVGTTKTLTATISPAEYTGSIIWSSSNKEVATVDENGTITAVAPGTTIVSVTSDNGKTAQCTVTVKAPATSIKLNKNEITLEKGYTEKLSASMLPTNTTDTISWSSSSSTYASVANDGTITANRVGTATITATTTSGQKAYCVVKVVNPVVPVASVTLDKTEHIMTKSETIQLKGTVLPSDATNKDLSWSTSDDTVASVNENGVVTANSVGVATITATANNGMYHECIIKVVSASGPSIVLTSENAIPNAISKVKASIVRNPGISGYKFAIKYDDTLLTPISVTANEEFGGTLTTNLDDENRTEFNVVWYSNGDTDIDINGELFTIDFKVTETAELGDYSDISIEYGAKDICNTAGENIALYTESAKVTVEEPLAGDIYEDGDVNIYDLTLLARYMIGLADFTDRQLEAANVTDDELVDIKDVVKLAQYVVGWTGVELMSLMSLNADVPKTPTVTVGTASVNDVNEADIPVYIKNNTGIAAYRFVLDYNADDIEIVSITPSDFINPENFGTNLGQENDEGLIVFCYQEGNAVTDGELFTIKVRYKNPTDTSVSPISIKSAENNFCNQAIENVAVNYETGYALGDDYIVANKVVGDTNFSCELYFDDSYAEQSAKAIIAFYDGDGRMVQLMPKDITVKPGKVDLSIDYDKKAYATYKLMIWEGLNSLKPITEVK